MNLSSEQFLATMKGIHWAQAKGHLRAMVEIDGSISTGEFPAPEKYRFQIVSEAVEKFIKEFEAEGLHE